MKRLTCEMCGSTELLKQEGVFVCQTCGTKYSVEEAKKMMIEGTVDVSGSTIIVDNKETIRKYYQSARAAVDRKDWRSVEEVYSKIELEKPGDYESVYFIALSRARLTFGNTNIHDRKELFEQLINSIHHIKNNLGDIPSTDLKALIDRMHISIVDLNGASFVYTATTIRGVTVSSNEADTAGLLGRASGTYVAMLNQAFSYLPGNKAENASWLYSKIITLWENVEKRYDDIDLSDEIKEAHLNWKKADPNHLVPSKYSSTYSYNKTSTSSSSSTGGCYVATCVYGSYDCPQVWTLRRYRDDTLGATWYGRLFIRTYYAISPTLVKWFGNTNWFKKLWKGKLDRMVAKLQSNGVEDTPYEDKNW